MTDTKARTPHTPRWQLVLAPWKDGGRTYTYFLPPELSDLVPGDTVMVQTPKGNPMFLRVAETRDLEPQPFPCKPVANGWAAEEYAKAKEEEKLLSMHPSYPEWLNATARLNAGEDPS